MSPQSKWGLANDLFIDINEERGNDSLRFLIILLLFVFLTFFIDMCHTFSFTIDNFLKK